MFKKTISMMFLFCIPCCETRAAEEYLIKFKAGKATTQMASIMSQHGAEAVDYIPEINVVVAKSKNGSVDQKFLALAKYAEYMEPNYEIQLDKRKKKEDWEPNDSGGLWGFDAAQVTPAWKFGNGKDVLVAVSDTGIWDHFDLHDNIWRNPGESGLDANGLEKSKNGVDDDGNGFVDDVIGWNFETNNKNPWDDHYHGTHVAGTIAAVGNNKTGIAGVAWKAKLMSVKFLGKSGSGTSANGIKTIIYAAANGAKAVNCSWGGDDFSQAMYDAIEFAKSKGTLVIAAAGNSDMDNDKYPHYPSSYENENLIAVAATTNRKHELASFSCFGKTSVDIAAPGDGIYSTFNPMYQSVSKEWFAKLSGTSMATPHVTGAVALLYSVNPDLKWQQVKELLYSTAIRTPKLEGKVLTGGALNVAGAAERAFQLKNKN